MPAFTSLIGTGDSLPQWVIPGLGASHGAYTAAIAESVSAASDAVTRALVMVRVPTETLPVATDDVTQSRATGQMPSKALPIYGMLYTGGLKSAGGVRTIGAFRRSIQFKDRPALKMSINSGYQAIDLTVVGDNYSQVGGTIATGNVLQLFEQGGDGTCIFQGIVEKITNLFSDVPSFVIHVSPMLVDLGNTLVALDYTGVGGTTNGADIGTMVNAICDLANYCQFDISKGNLSTGITAKYKFDNVSAVDALNECVKMLGLNWYWFCDAVGKVSLVNANLGSSSWYQFAQGVDYSVRDYSVDAVTLYNYVYAIGGIPAGATGPITATYDGTGGAYGGSRYGKRTLVPVLTYPNVVDQTTLNTIAQTVGQGLAREATIVKLTLPRYVSRLTLAKAGGAIAKFFEPASYPVSTAYGLSERATFITTTPGAQSVAMVIVDIEIDGTQQVITLSDVPQNMSDLGYLSDMQQYRGTIAGTAAVPITGIGLVGGTLIGGHVPQAPA